MTTIYYETYLSSKNYCDKEGSHDYYTFITTESVDGERLEVLQNLLFHMKEFDPDWTDDDACNIIVDQLTDWNIYVSTKGGETLRI